MTEYEMVGWHYRLNEHEFDQALGDGEGHGSLVCCSPWGHKESDMTGCLNNNDNLFLYVYHIFIHLYVDGHWIASISWLL